VGLSRNKVAVGESAAGSPPNATPRHLIWTHCRSEAEKLPVQEKYDDSKTTGPTDVKDRSSPLKHMLADFIYSSRKGS
jgi:hypothetical protein